MKKRYANLNFYLILVLFLCSINSSLLAAESSYETIYKIFQVDRYPYYEGCPLCREHFDTALAEVEKGSEKWGYITYIKASCLAEEGRDTEGLIMLESALKTDPKNKMLLYAMGCAYFRLSDYALAEKYLNSAIAAELRYESDYKQEGAMYYKLAVIHYLQALKFRPDDSSSIEKKLQSSQMEIKETIKRYNENFDKNAEEIPDEIITRPNLIFLSLLADIYGMQKSNVEKAISLRRRMVDYAEQEEAWQTPERKALTMQEIKMDLGQLLYRTGNKKEGEKYMEEAIKISPTDYMKNVNIKLYDTIINPPDDDEALKKRHPTLKEGSHILLE